MDPEAKRDFIRLQHLAAGNDWEDMSMDVDPSTSVNIDAVMEGSERIELSHIGGELRQSIEEEMEEEIIVEYVISCSCILELISVVGGGTGVLDEIAGID
jgi:hypothetical protein